MIKLFVGLGNPDAEYKNTRHNLGQNIILNFIKNSGLIAKNYPKLDAQIAKDNNLFAITTLFMNESGIAVQKIMNYFKITPPNLYVIHDDLDLRVGEYRHQFDRGPAGHNGIISIIESIGTQAFNRIRVGIDHPQDNTPVENYVLQPFTSVEKEIISQTIDKIVQELSGPLA